jgi:hypothetical protein
MRRWWKRPLVPSEARCRIQLEARGARMSDGDEELVVGLCVIIVQAPAAEKCSCCCSLRLASLLIKS